MGLFRIFNLALPLVLLLSCSKKEAPVTPDPKPVTGDVDLIIETEGIPALKEGDEIAVWDGEKLRKFTGQMKSGSLVFTGTATETDCFWALYPWSENCTVTTAQGSPAFSSDIPGEQAGGLSPKAVLIGKTSSTGRILMKSACTFLKFSFPPASRNSQKPGTLNRITFSSPSGAALTGAFTVSMDSGGKPVVSSSSQTGNAVITFNPEPAAAGGTYVTAVLPSGLNDGVRLDFERSADCAKATETFTPASGSAVVDLGAMIPKWRAAEEEADDTTPDQAGAFDYGTICKVSHPRVHMCDEDWRILKQYVEDGSYPALSYRHRKTIDNADRNIGDVIPTLEQLKAEYPKFNKQKTMHLGNIARATLTVLATCAYAYRMTGEKKYLDECLRVTDQVCADENWYPESFLSTAEITLGVSLVYDWLYYDLSLEERKKIHSNLVAKGITARKSGTTKDASNRGQVYNAGLMAAALAVYDKDKAAARSLMEESDSRMTGILDQVYCTKGSSYEGYGYWEYGANFLTFYLECLQTLFGSTNGLAGHSGIVNTGDYMLFMTDHLQPFPYADGGSLSPSSRTPLWWFAAYYHKPHILANELYRDGLGLSCNDRLMFQAPCALAKYPKMELGSIPFPGEKVWVDDNAALNPILMVRTGWNNDDSDKYLGLKGGYAATGHGHMDAGSFVYHAYGQVWSSDVGHKTYSEYSLNGLAGSGQYTPTSGYEAVIWDALAYSSLGHSTISFANYSGTVKKLHPTDHIVKGRATILESYTSGSELGGKLDLTPLFTGQVTSATRKAVIYDNRELRVVDNISTLSSEDAMLIYRLVTPADVEVKDDYVILRKGGRTVYLTLECTSGSISALEPYDWGSFAQSRPAVGTWGGNNAAKWDEEHDFNMTGFTLTIPKGTTVTLLSKISPEVPGGAGKDVSGETPDFNGEQYKWQ